MDIDKLKDLLLSVQEGRTGVEQALQTLKNLPFEDMTYAKIDHHRPLRQGFPEVVFGEGKTAEQLLKIVASIYEHSDRVLVTRISEDKAAYIRSSLPDADYHPVSRLLILKKKEPEIVGKGTILVISAGTSDISVAEEAYLTAQIMGNRVEYLYDVGVAGIHRLLSHKEKIASASVLIVVAGMEGALPSVIGGLVDKPVIAVPTSVGYGASFGGIAALLAMLNSCAAGVAVVNIDNGFGAGYIAGLINRL
ncbi:MAG: nickel pincer cofactor biosynthesis protein LarB [Thermodesulfobacteriota bacterium]